jgi:hypothetical protein
MDYEKQVEQELPKKEEVPKKEEKPKGIFWRRTEKEVKK